MVEEQVDQTIPKEKMDALAIYKHYRERHAPVEIKGQTRKNDEKKTVQSTNSKKSIVR
jgi:hypothetical protein